MILLQVDPASGDELETICEGCYKTKDTSIFAWSSIPDVGHYYWLQSLIRRLPHNNKVDYLIVYAKKLGCVKWSALLLGGNNP